MNILPQAGKGSSVQNQLSLGLHTVCRLAITQWLGNGIGYHLGMLHKGSF